MYACKRCFIFGLVLTGERLNGFCARYLAHVHAVSLRLLLQAFPLVVTGWPVESGIFVVANQFSAQLSYIF